LFRSVTVPVGFLAGGCWVDANGFVVTLIPGKLQADQSQAGNDSRTLKDRWF
jgi:hypothetical protein